MREHIVRALFLLCLPAWSQTAPAGWKTIKDAKAVCQISVPPDWVPLGDNAGAAVFHDSTTAIAVVTSQPGQEFKPLNATLLKIMGIPKDKMFENGTTRIFYQDKGSRNSEDPNVFSSSVPAKGGTCSSHIVALPSITEEVAKKIALSLSASEKT
jgi:hypothetical protein